ncbi:MAG: hypothetical protein KAS71_03940 [Bacteroidales bacterium]|nr:hypothetical protein [Bacteroidales bacterium]
MRIIIFIVVLFSAHDINYREIFKEEYDKAALFMDENKDIIEKTCRLFDNNPFVISSIIFPEAIRYSMIRDYLETASLELVYVSTGEADFSIGSFQIKPSFAERVEYYAKHEMKFIEAELLDWFSYDEGLKDYQIRKERLERLKSTEGQLLYVNLFYKYLLNRFDKLNKNGAEYLIKFSSTAYNHDFEADMKEIEIYMSKAFFPWGVKNDKEKFNYADIAWYYYQDIK